QILKDGTEFLSKGSPNLAAVIPAMDHIDKDFTVKTQAGSATHSAIRHALTLAKKTLNRSRYYSLTDESEVYRIAMVLHPQHKLDYFHRAGWIPEWIETAETLVRDEFNQSYKNRAQGGGDDHDKNAASSEESGSENHTKESKNIFDNLPAYKHGLKSKSVADEHSFISAHQLKTPHSLSSATSVDVERLFSRGHLLLSHTHSRLSAQTTRALACLGSWSLAGLARDKDVKAVVMLDDVGVKLELDKLAKVLGKTYRGL
ncbi:hypothetical protein GALMADRAFT_77909, partial [Galerina marginata CBS 339.88]